MSAYKNYTVLVQHMHDETEYTYEQRYLGDAKKIAKAEAAESDDKLVFIFTHRKMDGQRMYYNRDGFGCVGSAW